MYNISEKPKINYPKPKPRSQKEIDEEKERMAVIKKCPQKAQIEYPEPKKEEYVFHAVDSIPKRKN